MLTEYNYVGRLLKLFYKNYFREKNYGTPEFWIFLLDTCNIQVCMKRYAIKFIIIIIIIIIYLNTLVQNYALF